MFLEIIAQTRLSSDTFVIPSDINDNNTAKRILRHHQGKKKRQKKKTRFSYEEETSILIESYSSIQCQTGLQLFS